MCANQRLSAIETDLLWGEVLHASGDLVGTGHQVFEGELFIRDFTGIKGVVHAWWPPRPQVLPQVAFRGILHQHIQRTCMHNKDMGQRSGVTASMSSISSTELHCGPHRPVCKLPAGWWCFYVSQSSSSSPSLTPGLTNLYLWRHLRWEETIKSEQKCELQNLLKVTNVPDMLSFPWWQLYLMSCCWVLILNLRRN